MAAEHLGQEAWLKLTGCILMCGGFPNFVAERAVCIYSSVLRMAETGSIGLVCRGREVWDFWSWAGSLFFIRPGLSRGRQMMAMDMV